ncbi:sensor histidine kinase [Amycolatopsis sp. CA-230715]|uniref:sensor histidine kinase n=1 Tax=Amycolatopsis sp. CA-230715 TaxID=2745196 RepID=UPI001C035B9D|nr:histidine kinase [Amycolatopsis sp. CA-230715]QWF82069.1 hypothetical protein HUW46_05506 [Amycolatopsis sp. CA-230715]
MDRHRPRWHYLLGGLFAAYLLGAAVGGVLGAGDRAGWPAATLMAALHAAGLACCLLLFRARKHAVALLAVAAAASVGAQALVPFSGLSLLFLMVWLAPFAVPLGWSILLTSGAALGFVVLSLIRSVDVGAAAGIAMGAAWALLLAAVVHRLSVARATAELARSQAGAAMLAERQRLAREIHDVLAHSLSAQIVHLEGTRMLLERGGDAAQALDRVRKAGDLARAGLEETQRAVEALRGGDGPLSAQLAALAADFRAVAGKSCAVELSGAPDTLVAEIRLTVVRTVQEALTNVGKHAPRADVVVALRGAGNRCELTVTDTGGGANGRAPGTGYGLLGMRERAELIGGELVAGPCGAGFRVRLRVPS